MAVTRSVSCSEDAPLVRWGIAGRIVWTWVLTIPASGAVAAAVYVLATTGI